MQYIPLFYGNLANEGYRLNQKRKEVLLNKMSEEQLLIREPQLSGRKSSRSNGQMQRAELSMSSDVSESGENGNKNSAVASNADIELFSSVGLFDLLTRKTAENVS